MINKMAMKEATGSSEPNIEKEWDVHLCFGFEMA